MTVKRLAVVVNLLLIVVLLGGCASQIPSEESVTTTSVIEMNGTTSTVPFAGESTAGSMQTTSLGTMPAVNSEKPTQTNKTATSGSTASTTVSTAVATAPPTVHTLTPLASSSYYGLSKLKNSPNGVALTEAYGKIVEAVQNCQTTIAMDEKLTESEILTVFYHYHADYPQHFWCDGSIRYAVSGYSNKVTQVKLQYTLTGDQLVQAQTDFKKAVIDLLQIAATGNDEYERELLLHDALAKKITYQEGKNAHNAYGALVSGKAVCEGYARAFQYLLYQSGIQCLIAEGSSINPSTGLSEGHAWNVVRIDGQYYHTDLTWDDTDDSNTPVMYPYFNLRTAQIVDDHTISTKDSYTLPDCTATAANYHVKNGTRLTAYSVNDVAAILKSKTGSAHLYCINGSAAFVKWFGESHQAIAQAMGISRAYYYNMLYMGKEVVIRLTIQ